MIDLKNIQDEFFRIVDPAKSVSMKGILPDFREDFIDAKPVSLDAGVCFYVRNCCGMLSFTAGSESLIKNLCLTVCSSVYSCCRKVKKQVRYTVERAKNTVRNIVKVPCFLRL